MPRKTIFIALVMALICTVLGFLMVLIGGLAMQQSPENPAQWARATMALGCMLLLPVTLVGNGVEYIAGIGAFDSIIGYLLIVPLQVGWYLGLFWLGWKVNGAFR